MNDLVPNPDQRLQTPGHPTREVYATPIVDVESTSESVVLRAEVPGVSKAGIEVTVENGNLILVGRRQPLNVSGEPVYLERRPTHYRRVYELDPGIDADKITARVEDGVLTVTLPKADSVKRRKIALE
jgi:HSP20 family protein